MNKKELANLLITAVVTFQFLPLSAQSISNSVIEKRAGAEIGAKPCRYDANAHPSVLVTTERLSLVRNEILQKRSERRNVYYEHVKSNADYWLDRKIRITATGGWLHDFFCTDGSMLEVPENKIFDPYLPSKCPVCGKTYLNDKVLAARRAQEHYWYCGAVRDLSLVYAIEGKMEYAQKGIEILMQFADFYPQGTIMRQTLEEAVVLIPLAESYDLLYQVMSEKQRTHIREALLWPAAQALSKSGMGGNWGSWHLSAVGVIGYATRHQRFIDFATEQFKGQIKNQLGDDGLWPESVHTYHFYPLNGFLALVEAAANNGDDLYNWEAKPGKSLKKMFTAPLRYVYPNMQLAAINDGWYSSYLPQDQYMMAYRRYDLPEFAWAVQQVARVGKSGAFGDMLDPHYRHVLYGEPLPRRIAKPTFASIDFPVLGISVLRQGSHLPEDEEMMMTFDYGPFLGHGHPDKMNITLFAKGKLLIPDYGTTGYGSPANQFLKSTPSHNTIVVDGKNQPGTKERDLVAFVNTTSLKLASARTAEVTPGSTWIRTVMMMEEYAVVWDRIEGNEEHQYDWFFHAEGNTLSLPGNAKGDAFIHPGKEEFSYPFIMDVRREDQPGNSVKARWDWGDYGVGLWFMHDREQRIYTSRMPTDEGKQVPLLILRKNRKNADFVALIKPLKGKKEKLMKEEVQFRRETNGDLVLNLKMGKRNDQFLMEKTKVSYFRNREIPVIVYLPQN